MSTGVVYPNGQRLQSSALQVSDINVLMQQLTCGMLGINPPNYSLVRLSWQIEGQPYNDASQDVCYIACTLVPDEYTKVRNRTFTQNLPTDTKVIETWTYTRCWRIAWTLYGPNSFDRARMIHSALFMDYWSDQLNLSNLFIITDPPQPTRFPEKINAQWFERSDFHVHLYENVTETIDDNVVASVEVLVNDKDGQQADITVTRS